MKVATVLAVILSISTLSHCGFLGGYPSGGGGAFGGGYGGPYNGPPTPYNFQYAVNDAASGANFGQHESGDGGGVVRGEYNVHLPDGRHQVVRYSASDATGYVADVSYSGAPTYGGPGVFGGHRGYHYGK